MQVKYPRAQLIDSQAIVDPDSKKAQLKVVLDSGPEVHLGGLRIEGLKRYPATVITNLNQIRPGEDYSEATLQAFQSRLQDTGYFSGVEVSADMAALLDENIEAMTDEQQAPAAPKPKLAGPVTTPVLVRVTENKQKNVSAGLGYSTNTGNRAQLSYDDLSVFGLRFKSNLIFETLRQSARGDFYWPTTPKGYNDSVGAGFERTDLQGERTSVSTVAARRAWGTPQLERSVTLEYLNELRNVAGLPTTASKSVPLTFSITKRKLDNLLSPTSGYAVNAQLGGAVLPVLTDERFLRATARFVAYKPFSSKSTLIFRGEAGAVASRDKEGVPSTFLFRAGGDQSVRGYGYQQLGVREGTAIVPGRYLLTGGAEYQYFFKPPYGVAVFYDAGNAADTVRELHPKSGYGVGAPGRCPHARAAGRAGWQLPPPSRPPSPPACTGMAAAKPPCRAWRRKSPPPAAAPSPSRACPAPCTAPCTSITWSLKMPTSRSMRTISTSTGRLFNICRKAWPSTSCTSSN